MPSSDKSSNSSDLGDDVEDNEVYEVEIIRKWRYNRETKHKEYFIKWIGYPEEENTWEPQEHLTNCSHKIKKFRKSLPKDELECLDSTHPDRLTGLQRNAEIVSMYGKLVRDGTPKGKVQIYLKFEDDKDILEKTDLEELRKYRMDKAFEFIEQRLVDKTCIEDQS